MIRVIKPRTNFFGIKKCKHCSCVFGYDFEDVQEYYYTSSDFAYSYSYTYVTCPECRIEIKLDDISN